METRRTRPSFLSDAEAARDRERVAVMVRGITKTNCPVRIGATDNFVVDYDDTHRCILVYGKEIPADCRFKLALSESETTAVISLLKQARAFFMNEFRVGN